MSPMYSYQAKNSQGKTVIGEKEATEERKVIAFLRREGYHIVKISCQKEKIPFKFCKRLSSKQLAIFCQQFAALLQSALPILSCLNVLQEQASNNSLSNVLKKISVDIEGGKNLTAAFKASQISFPNLFLACLQVGETTGNLDIILHQLAVYYKKDAQNKEKIKTALIYPTLLILAVILMLIFFFTFLFPSFVLLFSHLNIELPWLTRFFLQAVVFCSQKKILLFSLIIIISLFIANFIFTEKGKNILDKIKINLPIWGNLYKKVSLWRFNISLSLMLSSGVPLLQALTLAKETLQNRILASAVEIVNKKVQSGESIAHSLWQAEVFPLFMVHMIAIGEKSGSLDQTLMRISEFYE